MHRLLVPLVLTSAVLGTLGVLPPDASAATVRCHGLVATLVGTPHADFLTGTRGRDVVVGLGGGDVIDGRGGDDVVCAGPGADRVSGGAGDDRLYGEGDRVAGLPGGRYLDGDTLEGGPGDDLLDVGYDPRHEHVLPDAVSYARAPRGIVLDTTGDRGAVTGQGHDTVVGTPRLGVVGSPYDDRITTGPGRDHVVGGAGSDVISTGAGRDEVLADSLGAEPGVDTVRSGPGADLVVSRSGHDLVDGGPGDDTVEATGADPTTVDAGPGDDVVQQDLTASGGATASGGDGTDVLVLRGNDLPAPAGTLTLDLRDGTTTLDRGAAGGGAGAVAGFEDHRLIGDLTWVVHGTDGPDRVWALTGGPLLAWTYAGDDWVVGTERDDTIDAGEGVDEVHGVAGSDTCVGFETGEC